MRAKKSWREKLADDKGLSKVCKVSKSKVISILKQMLAVWAVIQEGLGITYLERLKGRKSANFRSALKHLKASLEIFRPGSYPADFKRVSKRVKVIGQQITLLA